MKRYRKIFSLLLAAALALSLMPFGTPGQQERKVQAADSTYQDLNQKEIVDAMGAGWNLGNQLEANSDGNPVEDAWSGVKITERMIRTVKNNGFRSIRIPISYLSKIGPAPGYAIQKAWLDRIQEVVDLAIKYKLYVIINIHGDGYSSVTGGWILPGSKANQDTIRAKYEAVWKQIAERFKDYDQHLIYESMNEVGADIAEMKEGDAKTAAITSAYENINAYNQIFVDTVRQSGGNNDKRWLLVPGLNTNVDYTVGDYGFKIPEDAYRSKEIPEGQKRLMVSVHYYDPWAFCGQEDYSITQWGEKGNTDKKINYGQEPDMEKQFVKLKNAFTSKGYPVVIGEYGSIDKSTKKDSGKDKSGEPDPDNNKFRAYYATMLCNYAIRNGCVPVYWDNGWNGDFGFGLFDRSTYKVTQPEILAAIVDSYAQKEGTAIGISLNKTSLVMDLVDGSETLQATLAPSDAKDMIEWESSDESVATVNFQGMVTPRGAGCCIITATVLGGASAYCLVKVKDPKTFKAGLYLSSTADWSLLQCDNYLELDKDGDGGTFSLSVSGSKERMSKIGAVYIKDVTVERGVSETSILDSAQFTVDSMDFNGKECTMSQNIFEYMEGDEYKDGVLTGKKTVPDICMYNRWYAPAKYITSLLDNSSTDSNLGGSFPKEYYVDGTNTLSIQVTVKNVTLKKNYAAPDDIVATALSLSKEEITVKPDGTAALTASALPENATEKVFWFSENAKIATVAQNGTVTGIKNGETVIHALTLSGLDVRCKVTVDENAVEAPGTSSSALPSAMPSVMPSASPSAAPSVRPSAAPGVSSSTKPSTSPDVKPDPVPGESQKPQPGGSDGSKDGVLAKGTVFTAGKLNYKVTSAVKGRAKVAVKAPKSKKAKSLTVPASVKKNGISYSVTSLGVDAFKKCKKLKKITIGKNVSTIGKNAFSGCKALKKITVKSKKLKKVGKNALKGIYKKAVIKVPKKKLKKYRKLWKKKGQKRTVKIK